MASNAKRESKIQELFSKGFVLKSPTAATPAPKSGTAPAQAKRPKGLPKGSK